MNEKHRPDLGERAGAINTALFSAAEKRGYATSRDKENQGKKWLAINGERVSWSLYERDARLKVPLTEKERKDPFHSYDARRGWKQVLKPSGFLVLVIASDFGGGGRLDEQPKRLFEGRIDKILERFEKAAAETAERRKHNDDWRRRAFERQTRSDERSRQQDIENRKRRVLEELGDDWNEALRLRRFIDVVTAQNTKTPDPSGRIEPWLAWARSRVEELDPLAEGIESLLHRLFPPKVSEYEMNFGEPEDVEA